MHRENTDNNNNNKYSQEVQVYRSLQCSSFSTTDLGRCAQAQLIVLEPNLTMLNLKQKN
jgi:hypothetical protein